MAVKSEAVMKKDRPSDGGDWRWFYIHTFGTKILRDSLSPYFRGIIHHAPKYIILAGTWVAKFGDDIKWRGRADWLRINFEIWNNYLRSSIPLLCCWLLIIVSYTPFLLRIETKVKVVVASGDHEFCGGKEQFLRLWVSKRNKGWPFDGSK